MQVLEKKRKVATKFPKHVIDIEMLAATLQTNSQLEVAIPLSPFVVPPRNHLHFFPSTPWRRST